MTTRGLVAGATGVACIAIIAGAFGGLLASVDHWTAGGWTAAAAWATVLVAAAAIWVAREQLQEAQRLRREQAKPYVVAYTEIDPNHAQVVKLVVKNFGATGAYDVRISIDPPPRTLFGGSRSEVEDLPLPDTIPILVPGQHWETYWDTTFARLSIDPPLPTRHKATVEYRDPSALNGQPEKTQSVLDWTQYTVRRWPEAHTTHDIAEALRDIRQLLKGWAGTAGGVSVWTRDGHERDRVVRKQMMEREEQLERLSETLFPDGEPAPEVVPGEPDTTPRPETI